MLKFYSHIRVIFSFRISALRVNFEAPITRITENLYNNALKFLYFSPFRFLSFSLEKNKVKRGTISNQFVYLASGM